MLHVIATIACQPGARAAFLEEFEKIVPAVRAEDGCIEYGASVDVATGLASQPPLRPDVAVVVEKWRDLPALQAHLAAPHMTAYRARVKGLVTSVQLQVLAPVGPA
jgi:quinol monooxygenase YgiN